MKLVENLIQDDLKIVRVRVQLPTGEMVENNGYRVEIALTREAMIALSSSLLEAAESQELANFWHLHPPDTELISQNFGVYLHPSSCELLIAEYEFRPIEELVKMASS
jgi:hypothetical protein